MSWTKGELIDQAFSEIGLAPDAFNVDEDVRQRALRSLDGMMATWNSKGIRLGYPLPSNPSDSDIAQDSGLPDSAFEAAFLNLAIRIAPGVGKQVSPDTKASANQAYEVLLSRAAFPPQQQFQNTLPRGAGNKPWRTQNSPFMPRPVDVLVGEQGGDQIEFE